MSFNSISFKNVLVDIEDHVMILTINRPAKMNALDPLTHREMAEAMENFAADDDLWVAIVTGAGEAAFCAGGDLSSMQGNFDDNEEQEYTVPDSGYGGITNRFDCDKPVIAAVNGFAAGGGFEIVTACDLAVACDLASFGLPEPKVGVVAYAGGMHRLPRTLTSKRAMEILLTGDFIDADTALNWGLINEVVPADQLMTAAKVWAQRVLKCSPVAIRATKQVVRKGLNNVSVEDAMAGQERGDYLALSEWSASHDTKEGIDAFVQKRSPEWRNS